MSSVLLAGRVGVAIIGEAINEQNRMDLAQVLAGFKEGDVVEFDVKDKEFHRFHGAGKVKLLKTEEEGVGGLMRIKFTIAIDYIK